MVGLSASSSNPPMQGDDLLATHANRGAFSKAPSSQVNRQDRHQSGDPGKAVPLLVVDVVVGVGVVQVVVGHDVITGAVAVDVLVGIR